MTRKDVRRILVLVATGLLVIVPTANAAHVRPAGASPGRFPLVPAYLPCTAPSHMHGEPLAFASCAPPEQVSSRLTVGTPPAAAARMVGSWRIHVVVGTPGPPEDSGAPMRTSVTDVRCAAAGAGCESAGSDYAGELEFRIPGRISDHWNAIAPGGGPDAATVQDFELSFPMTCGATSDPGIGSHCTANADLNFFHPGITRDTKRMVWEFGQIRVMDGGADGDASTADGAETFLTQGVFVP